MSYEQRLKELGYVLSPVNLDAGRLLQATQSGNMLYTSGQVPVLAERSVKGKVGTDLTLEEAREAARICTINCLRAVRSLAGSLEAVARVVKVFGMVNVAPGFDQTPAVIDACSDLLIDIFGDAGKHARSAVGLTIPLNFAVEIEMIVELRTVAFEQLPP